MSFVFVLAAREMSVFPFMIFLFFSNELVLETSAGETEVALQLK